MHPRTWIDAHATRLGRALGILAQRLGLHRPATSLAAWALRKLEPDHPALLGLKAPHSAAQPPQRADKRLAVVPRRPQRPRGVP
jgi:hypothetical protein